MKRSALLVLLLSLGCATTDVPPPASSPGEHEHGAETRTAAERLEKSPRHHEWVQISRPGRTLHAYVTYPESPSKSPAVLLIHENRGLTDWIRSVADQLSEEGFIAIAPDFLSGMAPGGGRTSDFASEDAAREAISKLHMGQVILDLHHAANYVGRMPASDGSLFAAGFCWGGARVWQFANERPDLAAAFVFYGTGPQEPAGINGIVAPVFGFYGGNDTRVNATIPRTEELMRAAGKRFRHVIYEGAGHGFMRTGEEPNASEENRRARAQAWERWLGVMRGRGSS